MFKVKIMALSAGKPIVILNKEDANEIGIEPSGRAKLSYGKKSITCIVDVTEKLVERGEAGIFLEVKKYLGVENGEKIDLSVAEFPLSVESIRKRIKGKELNYEEFYAIVKDSIENNLTESELTAFVMSLEERPLTLEEAANLSLAMVETGEKLNLNEKRILDKHSLGGVPGDKTSLLLVPTIASLGYVIPKTSSRAITSPAGTADRAECLMPVELSADEMREVVEKVGGSIVWGGAVHLAPADDIFIKVERPLKIDPLFFPSIMAKKKAVGATHLVIDIPTGRGTKVKTVADASLLARDFIRLSKKLGIETVVGITYGEQPIGNAMGAGLEAREALETLMGVKKTPDLVDKASSLAGLLLELVGVKNGKEVALKAIKSGKSEKKLREIIEAQGGDPKIKPEDVEIGKYKYDVKAKKDGWVLWIDNDALVSICRAAGSPRDKGAGVFLRKKLGDVVKKDEIVFTIYSSNAKRLDEAVKIALEAEPILVGKREMLMGFVKE